MEAGERIEEWNFAARRKASRYQATASELEQLEHSAAPPTTSSATGDLEFVLAGLPEEQREVLLLRFVRPDLDRICGPEMRLPESILGTLLKEETIRKGYGETQELARAFLEFVADQTRRQSAAPAKQERRETKEALIRILQMKTPTWLKIGVPKSQIDLYCDLLREP